MGCKWKVIVIVVKSNRRTDAERKTASQESGHTALEVQIFFAYGDL